MLLSAAATMESLKAHLRRHRVVEMWKGDYFNIHYLSFHQSILDREVKQISGCFIT